MKIAFQGEKGAYSEEALIKHWGEEAVSVPRPYLRDVFTSVEKREAQYGLIPVENTIQGTIVRSYDLLNERPLKACGEEIHRIRHCLISHPDSKLEDIKKAYSHPQALGQSRDYLEQHAIEPVNFYDTAGGVKWIKENKVKDAAGVASAQAAHEYNMKILTEGIETNPENYTRFLVIGFEEPIPTEFDKTTLAFIVAHRPGTLVTGLKEFSQRGVNLCKIESRPRIGTPWEYIFFVEVDGHIKDEAVRSAIDGLKNHTLYLKHLGSYPKAG